MEYFAGLDVAMEETSLCVIDQEGKVVLETSVTTDPDAIFEALQKHAPTPALAPAPRKKPRADRLQNQPPPADVYFGRGNIILLQRERIKRHTIAQRRLQHQRQAASGTRMSSITRSRSRGGRASARPGG
jgi:hypothetical protein